MGHVYEQEESKTLKTKKQLKAFLHPKRREIIELIGRTPRTISQVAEKLGTHPANLTHHFKLLESEGIAQIVEYRDIGRNIEKYYQTTARNFEVKPSSGELKNPAAQILDFLKNDIQKAVREEELLDDKTVLGLITAARISQKDSMDFVAKLKELINEFSCKDGSGEELMTLNLSLYPRRKDFGTLRSINIRKGK